MRTDASAAAPGSRREDAERVLAKVLGEIAQERAGMPPDTRGVPTLAVLADEWLKQLKLTHRAVR